MAILTLRQSAKETGLAPSTISRAIESGRLNGNKTDNGSYEIEASELFRVFPPVAEKLRLKRVREQKAAGAVLEIEQPQDSGLVEKIKGLEALLSEKDETLKDLRNRLDQSEQERRNTQERLTALLTYQPEPQEDRKADRPSQPQSSLLYKLFGKR